MDFSVYGLIILGVLTSVNVFCTVKLYPGLKELVKELKKS